MFDGLIHIERGTVSTIGLINLLILDRFGTEKYSLAALDNLFSHLTNTSLNKLAPGYRTEKERVGSG